MAGAAAAEQPRPLRAPAPGPRRPGPGDVVRFHEKDHIGGKDVRVWHVTPRGEGFEAEALSAF